MKSTINLIKFSDGFFAVKKTTKIFFGLVKYDQYMFKIRHYTEIYSSRKNGSMFKHCLLTEDEAIKIFNRVTAKETILK